MTGRAPTIEDERFVVEGNAYVSDNAHLEICNAELVVQHYPRQEIEVTGQATVVA